MSRNYIKKSNRSYRRYSLIDRPNYPRYDEMYTDPLLDIIF